MRLKEYIRKNEISIREFSRRSGVGYAPLYRICNGYDMFLDTAVKIVKATNGEVTYEDLLPTIKRQELQEKSRKTKK